MRLSKQERIGALIILAIVILALGAFLLIKPKFEEVALTKTNLETRQNELSAAQARQKLKPTLREQIEAEYEEGEHMADMFFPELASYEADYAFRDFVKQLDFPVVVEEMTVEDPSTETLAISFYTPTQVTYALKTYVTQGLEPTEEELKAARRTQALQAALATSQTIGASRVSFTVSTLSFDDMMKFVDAINHYEIQEEGASEAVRKAIFINSLAYTFDDVNQFYDILSEASTNEMTRQGRELLRELGFRTEGGSEVVTPENPEGEDPFNTIEITVTFNFSQTVTFLSIERMQNPKALLDAQDEM